MTFSLFQKRLEANTPKHTFYFVRHGESDGNVMGGLCPVENDFPLTDAGVGEAERAAHYFLQEGVRVDAVYSSPLVRAHDTAHIIAQKTNATLFVMPELTERKWGEMSVLSWEDVNATLARLSLEERYAYIPPGGEPWQDMERRLFRALDDIANAYEAESTIVIVMHNGCMRAVLSALAHNKEGHEAYSVATGSITTFSFANASFDFVQLA